MFFIGQKSKHIHMINSGRHFLFEVWFLRALLESKPIKYDLWANKLRACELPFARQRVASLSYCKQMSFDSNTLRVSSQEPNDLRASPQVKNLHGWVTRGKF